MHVEVVKNHFTAQKTNMTLVVDGLLLTGEIKNNIEYDIDYKIGYPRTELKCSNCGGHLGHMFNDGPRETTEKRHCINGAKTPFIEK